MEEVDANDALGRARSPKSGSQGTAGSDEEEEDFPIKPPPNHNVTYGLYTLGGKQESCGRKINLVIRSNYHAYEVIIISRHCARESYLHP